MEEYRTYAHTPPHLYRPGEKYFITASTYGKKRILDDTAKERLLFSLIKSCVKHGWKLEDWVILDNHYHIMVESPEKTASLSRFVAEYHKFTALFIKKNSVSSVLLPKIFNNYWDTCITYANSYYARLNYIYYNPVKHGYVEKARDYKWGSFHIRHHQERAYVEKLLEEFPCDVVNIQDDY
jgi:putative transposase